MRISDDRISYLTGLIVDELGKSDLITLKKSTGDMRQVVAREFRKELSKEAAIDEEVRRKLASYSRSIPEGSSEWQVLYQQHYQEALRRKGFL